MSQIARMLTYAVEHQDEGRIPSATYIESMEVFASWVENLGRAAMMLGLKRRVVLIPIKLGLGICPASVYPLQEV